MNKTYCKDESILEYDNGDKEWYKNGVLYRDAPAIEMNKFYYSDGSVLDHFDEGKTLHRENGPAVEWSDGGKSWYKNGVLHREGGPAVEDADGDKEWYVNGKRHRVGGPAIEWNNGHKEWYINGVLHREDGPAVEFDDENVEWWIDGKQVTEEEYKGV